MGLLSTKHWVDRREPRVKVLIAIRVRGHGPVTEACLRDICSRGVLVQAASAPPRGAIVELVGPFAPVAARVVWSNGRRFGAELRERLDVQALTSGKMDRRSRCAAMAEYQAADRRARPPPRQSPSHIGRWMQTAAAFLIGTGVAGGMAFVAYELLADAVVSIRTALDGDVRNRPAGERAGR